MKIDIKVPSVGESITEGILLEWFKADGEYVDADEPLFELETDKITMNVQAESAGVLSIDVDAGADVEIGQVVGKIDTDAEAPAAESQPSREEDRGGARAAAEERAGGGGARGEPAGSDVVQREETAAREEQMQGAEPAARTAFAPAARAGRGDGRTERIPAPPSVRRLIAEHGLEPSEIEGSGRAGRVTRSDVLRAIELREKRHEPAPSAAGRGNGAQQVARGAPPQRGERETRRAMSSLRRRIAQRLVEVQQNAAILTTFNEADMSGVLSLRARYKQSFADKHGVRLGFMSFFVKAAVEALQSVPPVNARIDGDEIVEQHYYDIGVAVSTERGLVVPILRDADQLTFAEIEQRIGDFAERAQQRKLELSELTGGCFTISNGGVFGSLLSTPILNPPQSAILGMHAIKKRPIVTADDQLEVRPMMYLALSYDHRLVDGREAVTFLRRIVEVIEDPERLMLQV